MKTVKDAAAITGVSIRTLRYYDEIGLLKPAKVTEAGYRLYDSKAIERLQEILFFKELEIPLEYTITPAVKYRSRLRRTNLHMQGGRLSCSECYSD